MPRPESGRRRHWPIRLLAGLALFLVAFGAYWVWQVHQARDYTRATLLPRLSSTPMALHLSDLSLWQVQALLQVEDPSFYQHGGVDFHTPGQGLTTITQALVKIFYFEKFQPGIAKFRQTLLAAYVLEPLVGKGEQLRLFINLVGLGQGVRGFAEAAWHYFNKEFRELDQEQYLALVAMIIAPEPSASAATPSATRSV